MNDNTRVIDCTVDELQANLNLQQGHWSFAAFNWYERDGVRRVSVVMYRLEAVPMQFMPGVDPRVLRKY